MGATFFAFARMLLVLGLVIGLLMGLARVAKRFQDAPLGASSGRIEILSRRSLSKNMTLLVVRVAHRTFLVGQGAQQLTLLADLDSDEWVTDGVAVPSNADPSQLRAPRMMRVGTRNTTKAWDAFIDQLREITVRR